MSYFYGMDDTDRVDMVKLEIEIQEDINNIFHKSYISKYFVHK